MPYAHSNFDLINLYNKLLRSEIIELGFKHKHIADRDIGAYYHSLYSRLISCKPRTVLFSPGFSCPSKHAEGFGRLQKSFQNGLSIIPYQSKTISDLKKTDGLFFDWAIHHFHLGPEQYKSKFVGRTGDVAFALVASNAVLFLKIADHSTDSNVWTDVDLLEEILKSDSSFLNSYEVKGVSSSNITSQQRAALRNVNSNSFVTLSNGKTYMPIGGGVVSNGLSVTAVRKDDFIQSSLDLIGKELNKDLNRSASYFFEMISEHPKFLDIKLEKAGDLYFCSVNGGSKTVIAHPLNFLVAQSSVDNSLRSVRRSASSAFSYRGNFK